MLVVEKRLVVDNPEKWVQMFVLILHPYMPEEVPYIRHLGNGNFFCQEHQFHVKATQDEVNYYFHLGYHESPMNGRRVNPIDPLYKCYHECMMKDNAIAFIHSDIGVKFKKGW